MTVQELPATISATVTLPLPPEVVMLTSFFRPPSQSTVKWKVASKPSGPPVISLVILRLPLPTTLKLSLLVQPPSLRVGSVLTTTLYSPPELLVSSNGARPTKKRPACAPVPRTVTLRMSLSGVPSGSWVW